MQRLWDGKEPDEVEELGNRAMVGWLECREEVGGGQKGLARSVGS